MNMYILVHIFEMKEKEEYERCGEDFYITAENLHVYKKISSEFLFGNIVKMTRIFFFFFLVLSFHSGTIKNQVPDKVVQVFKNSRAINTYEIENQKRSSTKADLITSFYIHVQWSHRVCSSYSTLYHPTSFALQENSPIKSVRIFRPKIDLVTTSASLLGVINLVKREGLYIDICISLGQKRIIQF